MARNEVVGILSAALIAIQNWFVLNSAIGLREELISLLSLSLIYLFFKKVEEFNSRRRVVHYFVLAAVTMYISLTTLTTSISLIITIGLVGYLIDFKRLKEKHSGKALFLHSSMIKVYIIVSSFLIVYIPWGVHLFLETGHFNYMSRWQASFFYRVERGDSTWIDISFLDFIFNVRPFTETVGIFTIGLFKQVQHLFIGPALGGFLAFGFLLFGFFKTRYKMQVFIVLFFSIHLLSLALFSYFSLIYRYYLHLECFLLIFVSKGMVDFYNFMRTKPAHFAVEVPVLTRIQKKLGKKFSKIREKSEIKLDEKVMIFMSLTVIGITLMDSPHYLEYILLGCGMVVLGYLILNNFVDLHTWKLVMFIDELFQYEKERFDKNDRSSKKEEIEIEKV
ncbi:hypothetical protein GF325_18550 [Candidatus Bathyarchaeota archaeon]|nr:hypothetical protein [Candidatus Bathyarchaeota archaeon]